MAADKHRARELFLHAVGKLPPEHWETYVERACGADSELHGYVAHLLEVHRQAGSFLEQLAVQATIVSGAGQDIVIAGSTSYDTNAAAAVSSPMPRLEPQGFSSSP
jgi:hypothetical protein